MSIKPFLTKLKIFLLAGLGVVVLQLLCRTFRSCKVLHPAGYNADNIFEKPSILTFWHGAQAIILQVVPQLFSFKARRNIYVLISQHSDGRIVAAVARSFNLFSVAGSSSQGGSNASKILVERVKQGNHIAITPDGPRGPIYKLKPGTIKIANLTGAAIVPIGLAADRYWQLSSWDGMKFPKPFSNLVIIIGDPIHVPSELSREEFDEWRSLVENKLSQVTHQAERYFNA